MSPRYEPALYGVAESYQQQGRKDDAIAAFKRYLDAYPGAAKAQRQLDRLGGGASPASGDPTPPQTPDHPVEPAPKPTPTPTPRVDDNGQPQKPTE